MTPHLVTVTITARNGAKHTSIWDTRENAEAYCRNYKSWDKGVTAVVREWIEVKQEREGDK